MEEFTDLVRGQSMSGKTKTPPTTEERARIASMAAAGLSQNKIAGAIGRSRHMVKNTLAEPETKRVVEEEKAELSVLYKDKARAVLMSIDDETIAKGNLLQKATSSAILLDKSLLLTGDGPPIFNIAILMDVVEALRDRKADQQAALQTTIRARMQIVESTTETVVG